MSWPDLSLAVLAWLIAAGGVLALAFRRELARAWHEPVLAAPVLIVESDDWGYGPIEQAGRLREIAALLARHRDGTGHAAVMTLGVVLAGPDCERIAANAAAEYHRLTLSDARLAPVREAMIEGVHAGVFGLQLHGMEHYWPPVLMHAANSDARIRDWLTGPALPRTEELPSHLQSRWIDASTLPSRPLPDAGITRAVEEEIDAFRAAFGAAPEVAVPPTFVWGPSVERAWARAGLRCLVTPGRRYDGRDAAGKPASDGHPIRNGDRSADGLLCVVRDDYFEPAFGHAATRGFAALEAKTRLGRPALLETHRTNFIGDAAQASRSLAELDRLLGDARARFPDLRFLSTAELARQYREGSTLIERRVAGRVHCVLARLAAIPRLRKLAWASGAIVPAALVWLATRTGRPAGADPHPQCAK